MSAGTCDLCLGPADDLVCAPCARGEESDTAVRMRLDGTARRLTHALREVRRATRLGSVPWAIAHAALQREGDHAMVQSLDCLPFSPRADGPDCAACARAVLGIDRPCVVHAPSTRSTPEKPMGQVPSVGRIVHYRLTEGDVAAINRRRTTGADIAARIPAGLWPVGAQAHIGNPVKVDDVFPMLIVRVWPHEYGLNDPTVNGQVFLDGNDSYWVTSSPQEREGGPLPGTWSWPPYVPPTRPVGDPDSVGKAQG